MRAMVLRELGPLGARPRPLSLEDIPIPEPEADSVRVRVRACGVCHTELDEIEGRTPPSTLPRVLGHQIVGVIDAMGSCVRGAGIGQRVGVSWIHRACGVCALCSAGRENLCARFEATGRDVDGGYADFMTVPASFICDIPAVLGDVEAAPLLCAGAIGYRSLALAELRDGEPLGLTGFGASGHLVLAMAHRLFPASRVYVFARSGMEREFALERGAAWAGHTDTAPPEPLAAIIDTTPAWGPVVRALAHLAPAGRLIINAIRKEDADKAVLLDLDYATHLWREKSIRSVANVTRADVRGCLELAARTNLRPAYAAYPLEMANEALADLKRGASRGAKVLTVA
jgi:propanol-preferring alcohol dehydrogenase